MALAPNVRVFPPPGGLVEGYYKGYKGWVYLIPPHEISPIFGRKYEHACFYYNAGIDLFAFVWDDSM